MRAQALYSVLSKKFKDGEILFVDALTFAAPKAAQAKQTLTTLAGITGFEALTNKRHNAAFIALPERDVHVQKSFSNFGNVKVGVTQNLNPVDALKYKHIVIVAPEASIKVLNDRAQVQRIKESN